MATYAALPAPLYAAPTVVAPTVAVPTVVAPQVPILPSQNLTELDFLDAGANAFFASQKSGKRIRQPVVGYTHVDYARDMAAQGVFVHPDPAVHQSMTLRQQKNELLMQYQHRDQITNDLIQHQFVAQRERPLTVGQVTYLDRVAADNWNERNRLISGDPTLIPGTDPRSAALISQAAVTQTVAVESNANALVPYTGAPYSGSPLPAIPSPYSINNYGPYGVPTAPVYQSNFNGVAGTYGGAFGGGFGGYGNPYVNNFWTASGAPAQPPINGVVPGSQSYQGYIPNSTVIGPAYGNYSSYVPAYYGNMLPLAGLNSGTLVRGFNN